MSNTWTRSNKLEAYELIFKDFFGLEDDYPLYNVFHGPDRDIELIIQMSMEDMERLEYQDKDDNGNIVKYPLGIMWIRVLQRFKVWMIKLEHEGRHPEKDIAKWRALSSREYASFVRGPQCSSLMEDKSLFNSFASPTTVAATTKPTYTPADLFKKGIKRDKASFPVLKRDSESKSQSLSSVKFRRSNLRRCFTITPFTEFGVPTPMPSLWEFRTSKLQLLSH